MRLRVRQHDSEDQNILLACNTGRVTLLPGVFKQENAASREAAYTPVTGGYFAFAL